MTLNFYNRSKWSGVWRTLQPGATSSQTQMTSTELRGRTVKCRQITSQRASTALSCVIKPFSKTGQPQTEKSMSVWFVVLDLKTHSQRLGTSSRVSGPSGDIPAPEEEKHIHLPMLDGRWLIRPYVHQDLINLAAVQRHLAFCIIQFWKEKSFQSAKCGGVLKSSSPIKNLNKIKWDQM